MATPTYDVTVDSNPNETWYADALEDALPQLSHGRQALDVGDFMLRSADRVNALVVERKSVRDLGASMANGGRWFEQRAKMVQAQRECPGVRCVLAVVGSPPDDGATHIGGHGGQGGVSGKAYRTTLRATAIRDGIAVLEVPDGPELLWELSLLHKDLCAGKLHGGCGEPGEFFVNKRSCSRDADGPTMMATMVASLPGGSLAVGKALAGTYDGLAALAAAPTKELAAVPVGKKRIGPAFAARLAKAVRY